MRCYPFVSDFLRDAFGVDIPLPIQTFGFFVLIGVAVALYVSHRLILSEEKNGRIKPVIFWEQRGITLTEVIVYAILFFFIGWKLPFVIQNWREFATNPQYYLLSAKGNIWTGIIGLVGGAIYYYRKFKKNPPYKEKINLYLSSYLWNLAIWGVVGGFAGAKIFHLMDHPDEVRDLFMDPRGFFSGLTFHGGVVGGAITVIWRLKKAGFTVIPLADISGIAIMVGYAVGRLGCHFAGDGDWGIAANMDKKPSWVPSFLWGFRYPHNIIMEGDLIDGCSETYCHILPYPVYPTPLYEFLICSLLFVFMLFLWRFRASLPYGFFISLYLILSGIERYLIEIIRINPLYTIGNFKLSQAQIISLIFIVGGTILMVYIFIRKNKFLPRAS